MKQHMRRRLFLARGQVQGVGFRPFVWRLAAECGLTGFAQNTSAGVRMEVQGTAAAVAEFERRFKAELPPLARLTGLDMQDLPALAAETAFELKTSEGHAGQNVLVSADVAICQECLDDMADPCNRRHAYAFTNCVNCGPRFSITRAIPYDRPATTMSCFSLCPACAAEYANPANRRFHAQPIACPQCGPHVWFVSKADVAAGHTRPSPGNKAQALERAGALLAAGGIAAIRGLGGFQLACDARSSAAVAELRRRKTRPHKALAIMARSMDVVRAICHILPAHEYLLAGARKPITLCPLRQGADLAAGLAPDAAHIGVMLPYTPLHARLLDIIHAQTGGEPLLVMTSANPRGEPICLGNREALRRLYHLADAWLLHNRDILCRVDDSVALPLSQGPVIIRRARGYVPEPVALPWSGPPTLGAGAQLKAAFCLTRANQAFAGQHIGDLESPASMEFYEQALAHLQRLLEVEPQAIVHDLHPDYISTRFAQTLAQRLDIPAFPLQHHAAHAFACLADNAIAEPALALCLDGSGLGADGVIWGGELLWADPQKPHWRHLGGLTTFALPGGEAAIREPWRAALSLAWQAGIAREAPSKAEQAALQMLERGLNCPRSSSAGRLFDAAAAQLGLCDAISYEGQAAMRLEKRALAACGRQAILTGDYSAAGAADFGSMPIYEENGLLRLDAAAIFARLAELSAKKENKNAIALGFHHCLACHFSKMTALAAEKTHVRLVALSGGVLQNSIMAALLPRYLREAGLVPLLHRQMPPGDGGLALGQAVWGMRKLAGQRQ